MLGWHLCFSRSFSCNYVLILTFLNPAPPAFLSITKKLLISTNYLLLVLIFINSIDAYIHSQCLIFKSEH